MYSNIKFQIFTEEPFFPSKPDLIRVKDKERQTAKVSLNDCLACNGCVTTAETLLIQQQSLEEFLKNCSFKQNVNVVCVSNQSLISIAHYYNISEEKALLKLAKLFESLNVSFLFNLNVSNKLSLAECYEELRTKVLSKKEENNYILSSECPGWICYAEKIIGQWIIPHCSQVKSGQQIMGNLIKNILSQTLGKVR
jgi:iron only hydrogenase large subunit-like protein